MTREVSHRIIDRAFEEASGQVSFAFQGGEPTMAGLDFFRDFTEYVTERNSKHLPVSYSMQTNGVVIAENTEFAAFLADHKFLVGLSADGTKEMHDLNRIFPDGRGSYSTVQKAAKNLSKAGADFNILTVINSKTVRHAVSIYNAYRKNGWDYMQFIPCLGDDAPDDKSYGDFLCNLFDLWYKDMSSGKRVSIRLFDDIINMIAGYPSTTCGMSGVCTVQFVTESDGGIYPCDFYCTDEYRLGNLTDMSLRGLYECEKAQNFIKSSAHHRDECKNECKWYPICRGGCRRYHDADGRYIYCKAYKRLLEYSYERFVKLIRLLTSHNL